MRLLPRLVWIQSLLGFSSGLPYYLRTSTLTTWLATEGVDIKTIGLFALATLPVNLKFLWSAVLDRYRLPFLGARTGWIAVCQVTLALLLVLLASLDPHQLVGMAAVVMVYAFTAATQDVLVDAYRTEALSEGALGRGTSLYVVGYRCAMIVGGGVCLILSDYVSWPTVYYLMAGLTVLNIGATLLAPRVPDPPRPSGVYQAQVEPVREFFGRRGPYAALAAIAFLMLFKFGDGVLANLVNPFLVHSGFTGKAIGLSQGGLGIAMTIVGALGGGLLLERLSLRRALIWFGVCQALGNIGYVLLAMRGPSMELLYAAVAADNLMNGLGTAAFVACVTALCNRDFSVTQYALLSAAPTLLSHTVGGFGGWFVDAHGWAWFFAATSLAGFPALLLVRFLPFAVSTKVSETRVDSKRSDDT